jgi:hypothetical protein
MGAVLRGKFVVELVTEPLTRKVAALVAGREIRPAAGIKIDAERSEMVIGASGLSARNSRPLR